MHHGEATTTNSWIVVLLEGLGDDLVVSVLVSSCFASLPTFQEIETFACTRFVYWVRLSSLYRSS